MKNFQKNEKFSKKRKILKKNVKFRNDGSHDGGHKILEKNVKF